MPAQPPPALRHTSSWYLTSKYDNRQGPTSAAVAAVVSAPSSGTGLHTTSLAPSCSTVEDFDMRRPSCNEDETVSKAEMADFLAHNVIMSPDIANRNNISATEGSGTNPGGSSGGDVMSAETQVDDADTASTELRSSEQSTSRHHGRWRRNQRSRPQSAPVAPSRKGASTRPWDDVESRPSFEVSGLRTGVRARASK